MKRLALVFFALCSSLAWATNPTLVQDVSWGVNDGQQASVFSYHLPQGTLGGSSTQGDTSNNLLICGLSYDLSNAGVTATVADGLGNTWTTGPVTDDTSNNGRKVYLFYVVGAKKGTQDITVTLTNIEYYVQFRCSEFSNVEVSSPADGTAITTLHSGVQGPTVATATAITPTQTNDLIYYYGINSAWPSGQVTPVSSFVVGTNFNLLTNDRRIGHFAEYWTQASTSAVTPTITANQSTHDFFDGAAIALKGHSGYGTAPSGMRIVHEYATTPNTTPYVVQFPCSGNLFVATGSTTPAQGDISCIVDSDSNGAGTGTSGGCTGAGHWDRKSSTGNPQILYAQNATCSSPNTRTVTITESGGSPDPIILYDIAGAAASAYDATMGVVTTNGDQAHFSTSDVTCPDSVNSNTSINATPSTASGIMFAVENNGTGPECGVKQSNAVFDSGTFQKQNDADSGMMSSSSGYAHLFYTSATQQTLTFKWNNCLADTHSTASQCAAGTGVATAPGSGYDIAILAFKSASTTTRRRVWSFWR